MENQFLVGVANVRLYDGNDELILSSQTMLNTSIEVSTGSTEISGGKRNKLLNVYYHSGRLNLTLEDTTFNMEWIRENVGGEAANGLSLATIKTTAVLTSGDNNFPVVTGYKPQAFSASGTPYVYVKDSNSSYVYNATNNTFNVPVGDENIGKIVCLEYYVADGSETYTIPAEIIPNRVRAVLDVDIASNKAGEGVIGQFIINIPVLQLSGAQTISMSSDGYSTTPLSGMALAYTPEGGTDPCANKDVYAYITKKIIGEAWYSDVVALAVLGGNVEMAADSSKTIDVVAITKKGETKPVVWSDLTVECSDENTTLVNGTLTAGASAVDGTVTIAITGTEIETDFTVTITA